MSRSVSQFEASGLALAGYTMWVFTDTILKFVGLSTLPWYEIIALVGGAIVTVLLLRGVWRGELRRLWPRRAGRQLLRSGLDLLNNVCVVIALRHLPLALFYILVFCAPIVTTGLEAVFLREALTWKRALAIAAGFAGVVVAVNPFGGRQHGDWTGYAACGVCVAAFSVNMVWSRVLTQTERPESLTFVSAAVMLAVGGAAMLHHAVAISGAFAAVFALSGVVCVVGNFCFFAALKHAPASTVSQFHYSQLLTGAVLAYLLFGERLTLAMLGGAVLIVGSGLYTAASSYRARGEVEATVRSL